MEYKIIPLFMIWWIFLFSSLVSAVVICDPSQIESTFNEGDTPPQESTHCVNGGNETIQISKTGNFFTIDADSIGPAPSEKNIFIDFNLGLGLGNYFGMITFSDDSLSVPIFLTVEAEQEPPSNSGISIFPLSQVISVSQGEEKTRDITISVPQDYPETITIQALNFNPDLENIRIDDLALGQISPGQVIKIPIVYSGVDSTVGVYNTNLNILMINSTGQIPTPSIGLTLNVQSGINPGDGSFNRPSCSLSASTMNLNSSYELVCSGVTNAVNVIPEPNDFFEGIFSEITGGIYKYSFKPINFGAINFVARFYNSLGSPIFAPFIQKVTVSSSGAGLPGTIMKFIFTPSLDTALEGETVLVQIVDNQTGSIIIGSQLYVDAVQVFPSGLSFPFIFDVGRDYGFRAVAIGYSDFLETISLANEVEITIEPSSGNTDTIFNITASNDATLFINGNIEFNPFTGFLFEDLNEILAYKEGFQTGGLNITVEKGLTLSSSTVCKKDITQIWRLSKNSTWQLLHRADSESAEEIIKFDDSGSSKITFNSDEKGTYFVKVDDKIIGSPCVIEGWKLSTWIFWVVGGVVGLVIIIFVYTRSGNGDGGESSKQGVGWASNPYPSEINE